MNITSYSIVSMTNSQSEEMKKKAHYRNTSKM